MAIRALGDFIWTHVLNNVTAKLMALAMALVVWLYAYRFSYTDDAKVSIPVKIHPSPGWSVGTKDHLEVAAEWSYPRRFEGRVDKALYDGLIYLDCNVAPDQTGPDALDSQEKDVVFTNQELVTPEDFSLRIRPFKPSAIRIELVREAVENVRVLPKTSAPPPGYQTFALPIPATVRIRGQKDIIAQLARTGIETEEMDISSPPPTSAFEWDMPLLPARIPPTVTLGGKAYPISCTDQVQVRVHLVRQATERTFAGVTIQMLEPQGYANVATLVRERASDVLVSGPKSVVDALKPENIILYVNVGDLKPAGTPWSQPVQAQIDRSMPGAGDVVIKPAVTTCSVLVTEKPK